MSRGILVFAVAAAAGVLAYSGWRYVAQRGEHFCRACDREVSHSRTVALLDGERRYYCCPACALSEHSQTGQPVDIVELTDHIGGGPLSPAQSFLVLDSDVNECIRNLQHLTADKQPLQRSFDRCARSILAFRDRPSAETFAGQHGGQVLPFSEMASAFAH